MAAYPDLYSNDSFDAVLRCLLDRQFDEGNIPRSACFGDCTGASWLCADDEQKEIDISFKKDKKATQKRNSASPFLYTLRKVDLLFMASLSVHRQRISLPMQA